MNQGDPPEVATGLSQDLAQVQVLDLILVMGLADYRSIWSNF